MAYVDRLVEARGPYGVFLFPIIRDISEMVSRYRFARDFRSNLLQEIDLPQKLRSSVTSPAVMGDERAARYSLHPLKTWSLTAFEGKGTFPISNTAEDKEFWFWMDAPLGVGLFYEGLLNAFASFSTERSKFLVIYQIQGVRQKEENEKTSAEKRRGLFGLDWQKFLVECFKDLAKKGGLEHIIIRGAPKHTYLSLEKALRKYDMVAERLGFVQGKDKDWYKKVS